jgi:hypothetical protein
MGGDAVEVVVRFADTLLAAHRVRHGERYVIGTARDVDLPLDITTAFPLIESTATGFFVRLPVGVEATSDGALIVDREVALARGMRIIVALGLVTISVARIADAPVVLPRPAVSKRIVPYVIAALVAHVVLVVTAMWTADIDPITIPVVQAPPVRVPTKTLPVKPKPPKQPKPVKTAQKAAAGSAASEPAPDTGGTREEQVARATEYARGAATGFLSSVTPERLALLAGSKDLAAELADVGPIYDEDAANAKNFGGAGGSFSIDDPRFDSVKTGRYATVSGGRGAGANYRLPARGKFREVGPHPIMGLTCDDHLCKTVGSLDRHVVRDHVEKRYVDFVKCYERHAKATPRIELTLHFEIGADGRAAEVYADGATGFGGCIVRIVEQHVKFPADKQTKVTYPIAFWRS